MKTANDTVGGLRNVGLAVIAFGVVVAGLVLGRAFLIPLAIAIFLWNLLEAMIEGFASVAVGPYRLPRSLASILGVAAVALGFYLVVVHSPGAGRCNRRSVATLHSPI